MSSALPSKGCGNIGGGEEEWPRPSSLYLSRLHISPSQNIACLRGVQPVLFSIFLQSAPLRLPNSLQSLRGLNLGPARIHISSPPPPPTPLTKECITEGMKGFLLAVVDLTSSLCFTYLIDENQGDRKVFFRTTLPHCQFILLWYRQSSSYTSTISLQLCPDQEHSLINIKKKYYTVGTGTCI